MKKVSLIFFFYTKNHDILLWTKFGNKLGYNLKLQAYNSTQYTFIECEFWQIYDWIIISFYIFHAYKFL